MAEKDSVGEVRVIQQSTAAKKLSVARPKMRFAMAKGSMLVRRNVVCGQRGGCSNPSSLNRPLRRYTSIIFFNAFLSISPRHPRHPGCHRHTIRRASMPRHYRWLRQHADTVPSPPMQIIAASPFRTYISLETFTHRFPQPSIIARFEMRSGRNASAPLTILGAHQDSANCKCTARPEPHNAQCGERLAEEYVSGREQDC